MKFWAMKNGTVGERFKFWGCLTLIASFVLCCCAPYTLNVVNLFFPYITAHNRWQAAGIEGYTAIITVGTPNSLSYSTEEIVRNGAVVSNVRAPSGDRLGINEMFDQVLGCILCPLLMCEIEYDPTYGYPRRIYSWDGDLGELYEIAEFTLETE